ncbi:MAG: heavy-metal-associated domain-containing protein, partial [Peptostreptococcaceae bacterium]|nr:heavy-metal-associated domain-containing protein [Peptostreptococcaceae bacterium]
MEKMVLKNGLLPVPHVIDIHKRKGKYMSQNITTKTLNIGGMTCVNCESKIERRLKNIEGIINVKVNYSKGTAVITYDSSITSI